jgi:hypothetical protein
LEGGIGMTARPLVYREAVVDHWSLVIGH